MNTLVCYGRPFPTPRLAPAKGTGALVLAKRREAGRPVSALPAFPPAAEPAHAEPARLTFGPPPVLPQQRAGARFWAREGKEGGAEGPNPEGRGGVGHVMRFHCLHAERPELSASVRRSAPFRFHFRWGAASERVVSRRRAQAAAVTAAPLPGGVQQRGGSGGWASSARSPPLRGGLPERAGRTRRWRSWWWKCGAPMALSTRYLTPGQAPSSPFFPSLFFLASAGGRPGALFPNAAPGARARSAGCCLGGKEGPDFGPVGSPLSPAAFPVWGPGACRNEKRARKRGCPFGDRAPAGRAGDGRGPTAGRRYGREGPVSARSDADGLFLFS